MDVLKPDLIWLQGRCYRVNPIDSCIPDSENEEFFEDAADDALTCEDGDGPCEEEFDIEETGNGKFTTSLQVASSYFPFIVGAKGTVRRRLETETKTQIRIPRQGQEGDIGIIGSDRRGVAAARRRIDLIVSSARQKKAFTHFLSLPITDDSIKNGFLEFRDQVLKECGDCRGVDKTIFQAPEKLHLTLGTLVLLDNNERKRAAEILEACKKEVIDVGLDHNPIKLQMTGVEYMNDDPAEVDVLYGKVSLTNGSSALQHLADEVTDYFFRKGLMQKQHEQVKLHVTLINTLFRSDKTGVAENETSRKKNKPRESFDGSKILKMFSGFKFGEQPLKEVHLSQRYSTARDGYYQASSKISLL